MDTPKLTSLPYDILLSVAGHLHASHQTSLFAFSLTSRTCYNVALRYVFRDINLIVHDSRRLQRDVDAVTNILARTASAHHVRHLSIRGHLKMVSTEQIDAPNINETNGLTSIDWFKISGVGDILGDGEPYLGGDFFPSNVFKISAEEKMAWKPVIGLLGLLPQLTRLVYDCSNQFPPGLLTSLHQNHPNCKLYHLRFRLRSLLEPVLDPQELSLITSPNLHHIKIAYAWRDTNGEDDYHEEALPELVSGFAPNLREVSMVALRPNSSTRAKQRLRIAREPWRGIAGFGTGQSKAALRSLSLAGAVHLGRDLLDFWSHHTDFSLLSDLTLGGGRFEQLGVSGEVLRWLAETCSFPRLNALRIRLSRDDEIEVRPNYSYDAAAFFTSLKPLGELSIDGPLDPEILDSVLFQHGRYLERLSLRPSEVPFFKNRSHIPMIFETEHILQIEAHCPALRKLCIPIKRTKSDVCEARKYKTLKNMKCLKHLFLILDCSNWQVIRSRNLTATDDQFFDATDNEPYVNVHEILKKGHLRETFINCAVDETLVRSIWDAICCDKDGTRVESLKIYTTGGGEFGNTTSYNDINHVVENLSRSWLVERIIRDDQDAINVEELGLEARKARDGHLSAFYDKHYKGDRTGALLPDHSAVHIFRRIWPRTAQSKDWRKDWASFPLATVVRE